AHSPRPRRSTSSAHGDIRTLGPGDEDEPAPVGKPGAVLLAPACPRLILGQDRPLLTDQLSVMPDHRLPEVSKRGDLRHVSMAHLDLHPARLYARAGIALAGRSRPAQQHHDTGPGLKSSPGPCR